MQRVARVHRRRATFDVVNLRTLVSDDEGSLELSGVLAVDTEVRLQWHIDFNTRWHIDKRPTRPDRGVECRELVVTRRNDSSEVLLNEIGVLAQCGVHVTKENALLLKILTIAMEHHLRFVLRGNTCEVFTLRFRNAELLVCRLHLLWQVIPLIDLICGGL